MNRINEPDVENGFKIGDCRVFPPLNRIQTPDRDVRLEPKVMAVLLCLVRHRDRIVGHDKLIAEVWGPSGASADLVSRAIGQLRRVLDEADSRALIETVRGEGYFLHGKSLVPTASAIANSPVATDAPVMPLWAHPALASAATLAACVASVAVACWLQSGG